MSVLKSILAAALALPAFGASIVPTAPPLTVHEWGTFTSVASSGGASVPWAPLAAKSDLPCFVHGLGAPGQPIKGYASGLVRMETPVIYMYSAAPATVSVHVDFPQGWITEWYPEATRISPSVAFESGSHSMAEGSIDWSGVSVLPGANVSLPTTQEASHYFAARATDAAMLQSGGEYEKLLFYRGIANFRVPLEPVLAAGSNEVTLRNTNGAAIPLVIVFRNEGGLIGYSVVRNMADTARVATPPLHDNPAMVRRDLEKALEEAGMYPKEAAAMLETWRDSWFEPGMRVFYVMPQAAVDSVLPLKISPAPQEIRRAFVGRIELLSPWTERTLRTAVAAEDLGTLDRFGRFAQPFLAMINAKATLAESPLVRAHLSQMQSEAFRLNQANACVR